MIGASVGGILVGLLSGLFGMLYLRSGDGVVLVGVTSTRKTRSMLTVGRLVLEILTT